MRDIFVAQVNFSYHDVDRNGVHDFWTGDVAGLHKFGVIERAVAEADAEPLTPLVPKPVPLNGYYFISLATDESVTPPESLRQETDKTSGKVHHLEKWAILAYPESPSEGSYMFLATRNGVVRATLDIPRPKAVPSDEGFRHWGRFQ